MRLTPEQEKEIRAQLEPFYIPDNNAWKAAQLLLAEIDALRLALKTIATDERLGGGDDYSECEARVEIAEQVLAPGGEG